MPRAGCRSADIVTRFCPALVRSWTFGCSRVQLVPRYAASCNEADSTWVAVTILVLIRCVGDETVSMNWFSLITKSVRLNRRD
jgi:hypothetical protein